MPTIYSKEYYQKHKESENRRVRKYSLEHKEEIERYKKEYYQKNKRAIKERCGEYCKTESGKKTSKKYKQSKKGRLVDRNQQHLRRVQKNNGKGITNQQWDKILRIYNFHCAYCGIKGNMTIDHVIPLSKGGEHCIENVVPACIECNRAKSTSLNWKPKIYKKVSGERNG